eukprot:g17090.t1
MTSASMLGASPQFRGGNIVAVGRPKSKQREKDTKGDNAHHFFFFGERGYAIKPTAFASRLMTCTTSHASTHEYHCTYYTHKMHLVQLSIFITFLLVAVCFSFLHRQREQSPQREFVERRWGPNDFSHTCGCGGCGGRRIFDLDPWKDRTVLRAVIPAEDSFALVLLITIFYMYIAEFSLSGVRAGQRTCGQ